MDLCKSTQETTYLWFCHGKDQLLHTLLPDARLPLLARDHHEIVAAATKGDHRLIGVRDQRVLKNESISQTEMLQQSGYKPRESSDFMSDPTIDLEFIWEIILVSPFFL